jgi:MinD superfamily P-loop ATPase
VINRSGIGNEDVHKYCKENNVPILMEIPFDRKIAELYSQGVPFVQEMPEWKARFRTLFSQIEEVVTHGN